MVSPQLAALREAVAALRTADEQLRDASGLVEELEALEQVRRELDAVSTRLLSTAADRDATVDVCGRAPRSWLIEEALLNPGDASRRLRLVRSLPTHPATRAAFDIGDLSATHALVILDALASIPVEHRGVVEAALVELARTHPPYLVARAVDEILVRLGVEGSSDAAYARRYSRRGVDLATTFAGTGSLSGTLTPTLADKLASLFADCDSAVGPDDTRYASQRRHDRLEDVVDAYLTASGMTDEAGEPVRVVVTIPLEALENELSSRWGTLDSGVTISPATVRRLACDAEIIPAVLGARGDVLDLGIARRTFSSAVKRAAKIRDGGSCGFPGCRRRIKECHHIVWWSRGGRSTLANAVWLCGFHHWLAHEGGWSIHGRNPGGGHTWTSRRGRHVGGDPPPRRTSAA